MTRHTGHSVVRRAGSVDVEATANVVWIGVEHGAYVMVHPADVPDLIDALRAALADHETLAAGPVLVDVDDETPAEHDARMSDPDDDGHGGPY